MHVFKRDFNFSFDVPTLANEKAPGSPYQYYITPDTGMSVKKSDFRGKFIKIGK